MGKGSREISPGLALRRAWEGGTVALPGVFNPLLAKVAEREGFRGIYLSGGCLSASAGVPDIGLLSVTEFVDEARRITSACGLPLLVDADTGFGEVCNVERTIQLYEGAGVAGLHLEDQILPKRCGHLTGKQLVTPQMMEAKIRAAVASRGDPNFVILARTDARSVEGFAASVERAKRYMDAGADGIFAEAMESETEFAEFAQQLRVPLLANMTEFGRSPLSSVKQLEAMGYCMVLFPLTAFRVAMAAAQKCLQDLARNGEQSRSISSMMTRAELYSLLDYSDYEARDRTYFGDTPNDLPASD